MRHRETIDRRTKGQGVQDRRGQRGQSLVETALVLPILIMLVIIVVDGGRAFDALIVLKNAAREGARFASLENPIPENIIRQLIEDDVRGSGTNVARMANFDGADPSSIQIVEGTESVTVIVSFDFPLWFGGLVGINTFQLGAEATMPRRADALGG